MRGFSSHGLGLFDRQRSDPELDFPGDYEPRVTIDVLLRLGSLLIIVLGLALIASLLYGASR
jgi:hypothetical protein